MFRRKWFSGTIVSNEGFSVRFNARTSVQYMDGDGTAFASCERVSARSYVLYANQPMRAGAPSGPTIKDETRRKMITERIVAAGQFDGLSIEVDFS